MIADDECAVTETDYIDSPDLKLSNEQANLAAQREKEKINKMVVEI